MLGVNGNVFFLRWFLILTSFVTAAPLQAGDVVEVKSESEILETLDEDGTLDRLPFMPEMRKFCGKKYKVFRRAHKTCIEFGGLGSFDDVVFLENLRCDGAAHSDCGRACLIFWKESWLRRVGEPRALRPDRPSGGIASARIDEVAARRTPFFCQSTEIERASKPLPWWDLKQYAADIGCGSNSTGGVLRSLFLLAYNKILPRFGIGEWGMLFGKASKVPSVSLQLKPGEWVRVRTREQIQTTLDAQGKFRGMVFAPDMAAFCGKTYQVRSRLEHMILENTGVMKDIKDTVVLEGVECDGVCRRLCPRRAFFFWREAWLERVPDPTQTSV